MPLTKIDDRGLTTPIDLLDTERIRLGSSQDLEVYHDGHSVIKNNTANTFFIASNETSIVNNGLTENLAKFIQNGAVELYYNNSKKLETFSTGVQITGTLWVDGLDVDDNEKLLIGTGDDLQISHNGTNSIITNTTGVLAIQSGNLQLQDEANGHPYLKGIGDAQVELYHDGTKRLETSAAGVTVSGTTHTTGSFTLLDNGKLMAGNSNDLQIYHDGSNSFIKDGGGSTGLVIQAPLLAVKNAAGNENMLVATENGSVELMHDNIKMIETTSTGTSMPDGKFAKFGNSDDMSMGHNVFNYITYTGASLQVTGDGTNDIELKPVSNERSARFRPNGAVELYYDNSKKFETTSTGIKTVEAVRMTHGGNGVNLKQVQEAGVGNTASMTAQVPEGVGGGTVTVTVMHNGNTSISATSMFPIMIRGSGASRLGSALFTINSLTTPNFSVNAADRGVTVTNNAGAHAKVRVTFDLTYNG